MLAAILLPGLLLLGCGHVKDSNTVAQYYGNYHPQGWIGAHPGQAVAGVAACIRCHEISVIKVGSGVPTCMTTGCHHQTVAGWAEPAVHGLRAKLAAQANGGSLASCQICHGKDFSGGPSGNACATCHGAKAPHPHQPWRIGVGATLTHATTDPSNAAVCAQCHYAGSPNNPVGRPVTPAPAGTQPGCYNATLCHDANTAPHPVPFLAGQADSKGHGHLTATAAAFASDCGSCHAYSGTPPTPSAPLCNVCHQLANPTGATTGVGTCLSCHAGTAGLPTGPNGGTTFPSIAGAHLKHMNLPTALTCDTCHAGAGAGTGTHYRNANYRSGNPTGPATVAISTIFQAKTGGAPTFIPTTLTCSSVSCHGGQHTPSWQTGTINATTQCQACHGVASSSTTVTQFDDAFGRHSQGSHDATIGTNAIACTTCHNMTPGASQGASNHFKYLDTTAVDGTSGTPTDQLPSGTVVFDPAIVAGSGTYAVTSTTQGNGSCALTCHTHIHTATYDTWTASGATHPVPFYAGQLDNQNHGHLTATSSTFAADCVTCHSLSGASPMANAPKCATCHLLGDPTGVVTGAGTCLSCHVGTSFPTNGPAGGTFPSINGAHTKHLTLATTLTCEACHANAGAGTTTHYDKANYRTGTPTGPASVAIAAAFTAQHGGSPAFAPASLTCSNVSCHGGQVTPDWRVGTLTSATECRKCHTINDGTTATPTQYNDAVGRHAWGTHNTAGTSDCTLCHDMSSGNTATGAVKHFAELETISVSSTNKLPSGTIKFNLASTAYQITGAATYTIDGTHPETDGGCALACHTLPSGSTQNHEPVVYHWQAAKGAGIAHAVPFISTAASTVGTYHHLVTSGTFASDCSSCHDISGSTTKGGPTCMTCHTLADPTLSATGAGTCLSCHIGANFADKGPQGATNVWPNLPGAHAKHVSLLTFTRTSFFAPTSASAYPVCEACHVGTAPFDSLQTHYTNANKRPGTGGATTAPSPVLMDAKFDAQSGAATPNPSPSNFTCSNVSCHGGQVTPGWQSGTIPVNATTYCSTCHATASTAAQYNDATGRHQSVTEHRQTCNYCHDMTQAKPGAQNHFKYLDTRAVSGVTGTPSDQFPSDTIKFLSGSTTTGVSIDAGANYVVSGTGTNNGNQGRGGCALTCHTPAKTQSHASNNEYWN